MLGALPASTVYWHDTDVNVVRVSADLTEMIWEVEVSIWDAETQSDQLCTGLLTLQGIREVATRFGAGDTLTPGAVEWEMLTAQFEENGTLITCRFRFLASVPDAPPHENEYAELDIVCRAAWFAPEGP